MDHITAHAIDLIEAAYDLEKPDSEWLPNLLDVGAPVLDHGLGVAADEFVMTHQGEGAEVLTGELHMRSLPPDFPDRVAATVGAASPELLAATNIDGFASTWTEAAKDFPEEAEQALRTMGYPDLLGMHAIDPGGVGIRIIAPLPKATKLTPRSRERWKMLGAHIASGYRLRRALAAMGLASQAHPTGLPLEAEAVLDAQGFRIVDAVGPAKQANAVSVLRRAARIVDRSRGPMRVNDPQRALDVWTALVGGRWSIVDWFDTDGRRFVLAMPNSPGVGDPRGLTEQECQVVSYIVRGDTSKLVAYRLGLSPARVSGLLKSAMHKLGVKSSAGLAQKLRALGAPTGTHGDESAA